ncbi:uncharacterized protein ColSpa_06151 [Colletotrichum spaethianum]|uniref:Uncharacterized protein n=1 Tax=Colletotrichum spaethianum TaxID=700344 RepID=A0AA37LHB4_9PEZI|nr:uncharacterized protein ColSpa_06151 [Colletotrichum spaethianum]GKT45970.1 hypothetical protein ColSpa_06151 [Colletotrichum spaethianum]
MRKSTLVVALTAAVALLSSAKGVAADEDAAKRGQRAKFQLSAASANFKHGARSPSNPEGFVSYDYGYSYPPPSPPTTYAEKSSSAVTSLTSHSKGW